MPYYKYVEYATVYICALVLSSYFILYASDTNIIVTSVKYNDLQKKVNVTLQLISEYFQIIQHVLNKNTTFAIN
jgi:hypothetical protein